MSHEPLPDPPRPSDDSPKVFVPEVVRKIDLGQLSQFVTTIKSAEHQVGENVIRALQHDDTVAVLTTVAIGSDGQQHVVTAAIKPEMMEDVQKVLERAVEEREEDIPCVGFHCLIDAKPKNEDS